MKRLLIGLLLAFISLQTTPQTTCGVNYLQHFNSNIQSASMMRGGGGGCYAVDIAIAADFNFYQRFGSVQAVQNEVSAILNNMNIMYAPAGFSFTLSELRIFTTGDPYTPAMSGQETDPNDLLDKFSIWAASASGFTQPFDVGSLLSGLDFTGTIVGLANVGAACDASFGFNITQWAHFTSFTSVQMAHEVGHNLGAEHDGSGNACPLTGYVMSAVPVIADQLLTFSGCSEAYFSNFINFGNSACLQSVACIVHISGAVLTEQGVPVPGVSLSLTGADNLNAVTGNDGRYNFDVVKDGNYAISPSKNNDVTTSNGISTLDLLLIQRHILAISGLSTPYKIIAADGNGANGVTTFDILLGRAIILGNSSSYPNGMLWKFVSSDYVFPDPKLPFPFENTRTYNNISQSYSSQNFIGIKLGDVNNSWDAGIP